MSYATAQLEQPASGANWEPKGYLATNSARKLDKHTEKLQVDEQLLRAIKAFRSGKSALFSSCAFERPFISTNPRIQESAWTKMDDDWRASELVWFVYNTNSSRGEASRMGLDWWNVCLFQD